MAQSVTGGVGEAAAGDASGGTRVADVLAPSAPNDGLSFDELSRSYNYCLTSDRRGVRWKLLLDELRGREHPVRALDVGRGRGLEREIVCQRAMRPHIDDYWGIEPDETVTPEPGVFDHFQHALMETADLPQNAFDLVYSYMVIEHVADPTRFLRAVHRCLKPGGVHISMTPNGRNFVTLCSLVLNRVRLDEIVLSLLRPKEKKEYHYPVQYKLNFEGQLRRACAAAGFDTPSFAYVVEGSPNPYFPGPLRPVAWRLNWKRRVIKDRGALVTMIVRMQKPAQ